MKNKAVIKFIISLLLVFCSIGEASINLPQIAKGQAYRIGIQVGHWPEAGAYSCDRKINEIDIGLAVAREIKNILEKQGITVDILEGRATAVHNYSASAFVSLHTDYCAGNNSGFKVSRWKGSPGSGIDGSGDQSDLLVESLWTEYEKATGRPRDTSVGHFTPCFRTYYALNPIDGGPVCIGDGNNSTQIRGISDSTPGAIIEMGWLSGDLPFMTSQDGQIKMATGIVNGILAFLKLQPTILPTNSGSSSVLVFDSSGSMGELDSSGLTKIEASLRAGTQILNVIAAENSANGAQNEVGIASYSTTPYIVAPLTNDISSLYSPLNSIFPTDRTAMADGLKTGLEMFTSTQDKRILILLSDGLANIGLNTDMNMDYQIIKQQVLDLASQAGRDGICIYTVGFGESTSLDEEFLRQVATTSGCGSYFGAVDAISLANVYVGLRHSSTGNVLSQQTGQISQGQQIDLGNVDVPENQELMLFTLNWPGSKLEAILKDPAGTVVDQNYPGTTFSVTSSLVSVIINRPMAGAWNLGILGVDVPEGTTVYNAILSARQGVALPTPVPTATPTPAATGSSGGFSFVLLTLVLVGGGLGVYVYSNSLKRGGRKNSHTLVQGASLLGIRGTFSGRTIPLQSEMQIGRGSQCNIHLPDANISRLHAVLRFTQGGWIIQDQGSATGTYLNGQRVNSAHLRAGDQVQIGTNVFIFRQG